MKVKSIQTEELQKTASSLATKFKITRSAIEEMYKDDASIGRNVNRTRNESTSETKDLMNLSESLSAIYFPILKEIYYFIYFTTFLL